MVTSDFRPEVENRRQKSPTFSRLIGNLGQGTW